MYNQNIIGALTSSTRANAICPKYVTLSADETYNRQTGISIGSNGQGANPILIYDLDLDNKTSEQIASLLNGVMLDYELATPIVYTDLQYADGISFNNLWFKTYKNGLVIQNPQTPLSAPMDMDYEKPYDMPAEYICMDSFDALLDQLGNSMNGIWTKTYNEENQAYEFSFTPSN